MRAAWAPTPNLTVAFGPPLPPPDENEAWVVFAMLAVCLHLAAPHVFF